MGLLYVDTIEPQSGTALTVGESGQNTVLPGNDLRANVLQDAGGNAIFTSDGSGNVTGVNSDIGAAMVLIQSQTASSSANIAFTSPGFTNTYDEYIFKFYNIHPATNGAHFTFQVSSDSGSTYGKNMLSATADTYNPQSGAGNFTYSGAADLPTGGGGAGQTNYQILAQQVGGDNDESLNGTLHMTVPSKTDRFKPWWSRVCVAEYGDYADDGLYSGIVYQTAAIDAINFKFSSGNIDAGIIKMFGVK